jgi:hypothetical protein
MPVRGIPRPCKRKLVFLDFDVSAFCVSFLFVKIVHGLRKKQSLLERSMALLFSPAAPLLARKADEIPLAACYAYRADQSCSLALRCRPLV